MSLQLRRELSLILQPGAICTQHASEERRQMAQTSLFVVPHATATTVTRNDVKQTEKVSEKTFTA
jgi:hypothetical protein